MAGFERGVEYWGVFNLKLPQNLFAKFKRYILLLGDIKIYLFYCDWPARVILCQRQLIDRSEPSQSLKRGQRVSQRQWKRDKSEAAMEMQIRIKIQKEIKMCFSTFLNILALASDPKTLLATITSKDMMRKNSWPAETERMHINSNVARESATVGIGKCVITISLIIFTWGWFKLVSSAKGREGRGRISGHLIMNSGHMRKRSAFACFDCHGFNLHHSLWWDSSIPLDLQCIKWFV